MEAGKWIGKGEGMARLRARGEHNGFGAEGGRMGQEDSGDCPYVDKVRGKRSQEASRGLEVWNMFGGCGYSSFLWGREFSSVPSHFPERGLKNGARESSIHWHIFTYRKLWFEHTEVVFFQQIWNLDFQEHTHRKIPHHHLLSALVL